MRPKATKWIKAEELSMEQQRAIDERRFGRCHPSNYPTRPMRKYQFYLEDGPGWRVGDVAGWGPVAHL